MPATPARPSPIGPLTVGSVASTTPDPPQHLEDFLYAMGGSMDSPVHVFTCVPEADLQAALSSMHIQGTTPNGMQKAELVKFIRTVYTIAELEPPSLGAAVPMIKPAEKGGPSPQGPAAVREFADARANEVFNQMDTSQIQLLPPEELRQARRNYKIIMGGSPDTDEAGTNAQISAVAVLLRAGKAPDVDFAVWTAFQGRNAKLHRFYGRVLRDNQWVSMLVVGPESSEVWLGSWQVFQTVLISLGAASPESCKKYAKGIKNLGILLPDSWAHIMQQEALMRCEQWELVHEECVESPPPGFNPSRPWDWIILQTSFGLEGGIRMQWWNSRVAIPCQRSSSSSSAGATVAKMEGYQAPKFATGPGRLQGPPAKREQSRSRTPLPRLQPQPGRGPSDEVCVLYNSGTKQCGQTKGPCKYGRLHACSSCYPNGDYYHPKWCCPK